MTAANFIGGISLTYIVIAAAVGHGWAERYFRDQKYDAVSFVVDFVFGLTFGELISWLYPWLSIERALTLAAAVAIGAVVAFVLRSPRTH